MAVSEIIGAAIGVLLLVIVAYVVVGSTLYAAETVTTAQKDLTLLQEARLRTSFSITDQKNDTTNLIIANITNTGTEIIGDFKHTDVIVYDKTSSVYGTCNYTTGAVTAGRWGIRNDFEEFIHKNELDPGEKYEIWIQPPVAITDPKWFQITTANGVFASAFI
jgi:archaeal flagellar protein FlaF